MYTVMHPSGTDQTAELIEAMGSGGNVVQWVPGAVYQLNALQPVDGTRFIGYANPNYTEPEPYNNPTLIPAPGATCVFDCSRGARSVTMQGFTIDGQGRDVTAISGGSEHLTIDGLYIVNVLDGLGGAYQDGSNYTYVVSVRGPTRFVRCARNGIDSPVDSTIDAIIADCGTSVYARPGANHNRIEGRFEWTKKGAHFRLVGADAEHPVRDWTFGTVQMDRAATCSVFLRHCLHIQFGGSVASERPGRLALTGAGESAHFYVENSKVITATGVMMWAGAGDKGEPPYSPVHGWQFKGVNPGVIIGLGSMIEACTGESFSYLDGCSDETMPGHIIANVGGVPNRRVRRHRWLCPLDFLKRTPV